MIFSTFIVPTVGRPTLVRALDSLSRQTDPDWSALVVADGVGEFFLPRVDDRIFFVNLRCRLGDRNFGGSARNHGMAHAPGEWISFVDDDDRVDVDYVAWLKGESSGMDMVVFRMQYQNGAVLPEGNDVGCGQVGISFSLRRDFQRERNLWFPNSAVEDWSMVQASIGAGARWKISSRVAYYVRF